MSFETEVRNKVLRIGRLLLAALVVVLGAAVLVYAATYTIDTNDETVDEWWSQGISVFQTDEEEDDVNDDEDILNAWVATGENDFIYFLMQVAGSPALDSSDRGAVASIDCDNDGIDEEHEDRLVTYNPPPEWVTICYGDNIGYCASLSQDYGQRVGEYLEWGVPMAELPLQEGGSDYCQGQVGIRFATANTSSFTRIDQTDSLRPYNMPTAVTFRDFRATNGVLGAIAVTTGVIGLGVFTGLGTLAFVRRRRQ